ncbi:MAG TPA: GIY-YIG nuclease family protein [Methylotenera sp.]|nr:GIY-YIG nuclease family protein [Methylotenera sp.]
MAKAQFTDEDDALLAELGVDVEAKSTSSRTPREERIIAGFEEIERFVETYGRLPQHGEDKDIFERIYAVRLDKIRSTSECKELLASFDKNGLLSSSPRFTEMPLDELDDDALLAQLGVSHQPESDITRLTHVKSRAEKKAVEEMGRRSLCNDFENFKPLFEQIQAELKAGMRKTLRFKEDASINKGEYFIVGGQIAFIAEVGELTQDAYSKWDARLRIIFDNGTESNILLRSLQKALYKDESGRRITEPNAGPLFDDIVEDEDIESGTIYVLRSKSEHPDIKPHANLLHKIGVTGGNVATRISNAKLDPTFLMADVEIIATYELYNINRVKLENLLHRFFDAARLNIQISDRFGNPIYPREWFLVPLFIIDEVVEKIKDGSLSNYSYEPNEVKLLKH